MRYELLFGQHSFFTALKISIACRAITAVNFIGLTLSLKKNIRSLVIIFYIAAICHAPSKLSAEQIADRLGRPYNTMMSELSPISEGHKFDVNLFVPFMRLAGSTEPLHAMARVLSGVYLPTAEVRHPVHV